MHPQLAVDPDAETGFGLAYVACFAIALSLVSCGLVVAARSGLESPPLLAPACALVFAAAALSPFALPARARRALAPLPCAVPLLVLCVLLSPVLGWLVGPLLLPAWAVVAALGAPRAMVRLRGISAGQIAFLTAGPPLLAIYAFCEVHARAYAHVYAPEFAKLGILSLDTLFHTAMSHMLQSFGRPSTGIDGLVPFRYHLGSHAWFAGLGLAAHGAPLFSYPYGQLGVAVPALFGSLFAATQLLARSPRAVATRIAVAASLVIVSDRVGWNSYYISESYTFGLVALLLGLPFLLDFARASERPPWAAPTRTALLLAWVAVAVCLKLSVGVVLGVCVGWTALRRHGISLHAGLVGAALAVVAAFAWWAVKSETDLSLSESFQLLHFYRGPGVIGMSRVAGFTSPLLPLLYLLWTASRRRRPDRRGAAGLLAVATGFALLPSLALVLWSGTAWWFANVPHWLALPLLAAEPPLERLAPRSRRWVAAALAGFLALWLATAARGVRPQRLVDLARRVYVQTGVDAQRHLVDPAALWSTWGASLAAHGALFEPRVRERLELSHGGRLARAFARALERGGRDGLAIFVPPANEAFWNAGDWRCFKRPLLVPALTGAPLLKGIAPDCPLVGFMGGYGFGSYGEDSRSADLAPLELCRHAARRGFRRILVLKDLALPPRSRVLDCRALEASSPG